MDLISSGKKGFEMSETSSPIMLLRPEASVRAWAFGWYSKRSMARITFLRVSSLTYFVRLMTCETVAVETPASCATSLMRGGLWGNVEAASPWGLCWLFIVPFRCSGDRAPPGDSGGAVCVRAMITPEGGWAKAVERLFFMTQRARIPDRNS